MPSVDALFGYAFQAKRRAAPGRPAWAMWLRVDPACIAVPSVDRQAHPADEATT